MTVEFSGRVVVSFGQGKVGRDSVAHLVHGAEVEHGLREAQRRSACVMLGGALRREKDWVSDVRRQPKYI